ncbi:MAG: hypothetical protein H6953_16110 [Chromatiaceae bacterium]|nr:hypothetical protein [Chromatiaceae bacterium]
MTDEKGPDELAAELQAAIDPVLKRLDESAQWRNQPNHPELARLAAQHARRDFWRLQEAFNLAAGFHPARDGWGRDGDLQLARGCVGPDGSLKVVNPKESERKWRVRPSDFIQWADTKGISVHPAVLHACRGGSAIPKPPSQVKATRVRQSQVELRSEKIQEFLGRLDQLSANYRWDRTRMPVTWDDVHRVFYRLYPDVKEVSPGTLAIDFKKSGARCAPGTPSKTRTVLEDLFQV